MLALGATVEARRIDRVPSGPQAVCHRLPNPAALVRAVDQNESRHCAVSFLLLNAGGRARLSRTKPPLRPSGGRGRGPARQRREGEVGGATVLRVRLPSPCPLSQPLQA